jgi:hypothetical protein
MRKTKTKRLVNIAILALSLVMLSFTEYTTMANDCSIMKQGTFAYGRKNNKVIVKIKEYTHTEFHNNGKYYMVSKINWIDDCSYTATLVENTVPTLPIKIGTKLTVHILKVRGNKISYEAGFGGRMWKGKYTKISDRTD